MKLDYELTTAIARLLIGIEKLPEDTAYYVWFDEARDDEHPIQFDIATRDAQHYRSVLQSFALPSDGTEDVAQVFGWLKITIQKPEDL